MEVWSSSEEGRSELLSSLEMASDWMNICVTSEVRNVLILRSKKEGSCEFGRNENRRFVSKMTPRFHATSVGVMTAFPTVMPRSGLMDASPEMYRD